MRENNNGPYQNDFIMNYPEKQLRKCEKKGLNWKSTLVALSGSVCLSLTSCQPTQETKSQEAQPPNVLYILADDLGYFDLSHTGSPYYDTPHTDRIAQMGMEFTHGYANSPVCSPARASLMTGQFPSRHGITDWIGARTGEDWRGLNRHSKMLPPDYVSPLPSDHVTLAEAMQMAGYTTFLAGKWHLGSEGSWPEDHGFDINVGGWDRGSPIGGYFDPYENPNLENRQPGENLSMRLADETVDFFRDYHPDKTGKPVFAYLSFYAVHGPLQTTREKWKKYRDKADSLGIAESGFEMGRYLPVRLTQDNPVYGGLVEAMDDAVGHVMNGLEDLGLDQNTIIVFTSDHGGVSSGDAFATSNLPFRKGKGSTFEGGLRVPFFIAAPGLIVPGTTSETPVTGADLYPTILDLTGQELLPEQHVDGVSLVPVLKGGSLEDRYLIWHYPHYGNQDGRPSGVIRNGDWKLIHDYETQDMELYNLRTDISEHRDLSDLYPQKTEHLYETMMDHFKEVGARFPVPDPQHDPEAERAHLQRIEQNRMENLERQRMRFLSPDYNPGNNWWGSDVTQ